MTKGIWWSLSDLLHAVYLWGSHFLPLLVLMRRGAAPVKPVLVIVFLANATAFPEITTSAGANFGDIPDFQYCPGHTFGSESLSTNSPPRIMIHGHKQTLSPLAIETF